MEQFLQGNVPLRHLLHEEILFISCWRSAIKVVNDWSLNLVLRNAFRQNRTISQIRLLDQQQFCHVFDETIISFISLFYSIHYSCFCIIIPLEKKWKCIKNSYIKHIFLTYMGCLHFWQKLHFIEVSLL